MCYRDTIIRDKSSAASNTIFTPSHPPRHGCGQSCRNFPQEPTMTFKEVNQKEKMWCSQEDRQSSTSKHTYNTNASTIQLQLDTTTTVSKLSLFPPLYNTFTTIPRMMLRNAPANFYSLVLPFSSSMRSSTSSSAALRLQSLSPLRFILLTFCLLSGKPKFYFYNKSIIYKYNIIHRYM